MVTRPSSERGWDRIALQEAEDERMARQLAHGVDGAEVVCVCGGGVVEIVM